VRAKSRSAAEAELRKRLAQRNLYQPVDTTLTLDSLFGEWVDYWLADLDLEGRIAPSTRFNYERAMRGLVLPAFEHPTLREIGVARCDALLKQLGQKSFSRSKQANGVAARVRPRGPSRGRAPQPDRRREAAQAQADTDCADGDRGQCHPRRHQGLGAHPRHLRAET